jgi:hypothetical protein
MMEVFVLDLPLDAYAFPTLSVEVGISAGFCTFPLSGCWTLASRATNVCSSISVDAVQYCCMQTCSFCAFVLRHVDLDDEMSSFIKLCRPFLLSAFLRCDLICGCSLLDVLFLRGWHAPSAMHAFTSCSGWILEVAA